MNRDIIQDKKIIVYGLGVTGVSSCEALTELGASVLVYQDKQVSGHGTPTDQAVESVLALKDAGRPIEFIDSPEDLPWEEIDLLLKSPGIGLEKPLLLEAARKGVPMVSDIELAYRIFGGDRMVAITGSNGKTTTVSLLTHILNSAGRYAVSVGNIGIPILTTMLRAPEDSYFVVECSSFQLATITDFKPHLAAILNITPDHIEWHGTFEAYTEAKYQICKNQDQHDHLLLNPGDELSRRLAERLHGPEVSWIDMESDQAKLLMNHRHWKLFGLHNVENALFAIELARKLGLEDEDIIFGLDTFEPVRHRMELVRTLKGVRYINDSKATNVDAAVKALNGLDDPVILIAGGYDKHVAFDDLIQAFLDKGKWMILLGETKDQIAEVAIRYGLEDKLVIVDRLKEAVDRAYNLAEDGDIVLLSPASASWDQYENFEARGDEFRNIVNGLLEETDGRED